MRDTVVTAVVKKNGEVVGFCTKDSSGYKTFDNTTNLPFEDAEVIELPLANSKIDTSKSLDEIFENMVPGTPLKIKGCCDGMDSQQLIYVGKDVDFLGTTWHMLFDGVCRRDIYPSAFGYATDQLHYDDVIVIFNENDEEKVNELQDNFSFLLEVSNYI